jgi:hypothetical protein
MASDGLWGKLTNEKAGILLREWWQWAWRGSREKTIVKLEGGLHCTIRTRIQRCISYAMRWAVRAIDGLAGNSRSHLPIPEGFRMIRLLWWFSSRNRRRGKFDFCVFRLALVR